MGWSCTKAVGDTLDRWSAVCRKATGSSNEFVVGGKHYFFEGDDIEHDSAEMAPGNDDLDGGASGDVFEMVGDSSARKVGSYFILGNGIVKWWAEPLSRAMCGVGFEGGA
jgi:hypothetical protein